MRTLIIAVILAAASTTVFSQTIAITNGKIYPVSGPSINNGTVLIRDGMIVAVGAQVTVPAGAQTIDARGKVVTPGLINSITELGVIEIDQVRTTNDVAAKGNNNIAAAFRVWDGLNPSSVLFAPARNEGVTSAVIVPQGGLVSGQGAAIDLVSGGVADMMRRPAVAMVAQVGNANNAGTSARGRVDRQTTNATG
jgi:imidazolonepropionase-like amidohydrolase